MPIVEKVKTVELKNPDGERLEVTTVKFEPVAAFEMLKKLEGLQNGLSGLSQSAMVDLLGSTSIIKDDKDGKPERIELTSVARINRACGDFKTLMHVLKHVVEANYGDFFDEGDSSTSDGESQTPTPSP